VLEAVKRDMANSHLCQLIETDPSLRHAIATRPNEFIGLLNASEADASLVVGDDYGSEHDSACNFSTDANRQLPSTTSQTQVSSLISTPEAHDLDRRMDEARDVPYLSGAVRSSSHANPADSMCPQDRLRPRDDSDASLVSHRIARSRIAEEDGELYHRVGEVSRGSLEMQLQCDASADELGTHQHLSHSLPSLPCDMSSRAPIAAEQTELMEAVLQQWLHTPAGTVAAQEASRLELSTDEMGQFFHAQMLQSLGRSRSVSCGGFASLSDDDERSVRRLVALGFAREQATEAYFACECNMNLAANFLMDPSEDSR